MSRWISNAERLAGHLKPVVGGNIPVHVFRDLNIESKADATVGKASGRCVLITWLGGANPNPESNLLNLGSEFSISLWCRPDLATSGPDPDTLAETIAAAAHGWNADDSRHPLAPSRMTVTAINRVPNGKYYVVEIRAEIPRLLTPPPPEPTP